MIQGFNDLGLVEQIIVVVMALVIIVVFLRSRGRGRGMLSGLSIKRGQGGGDTISLTDVSWSETQVGGTLASDGPRIRMETEGLEGQMWCTISGTYQKHEDVVDPGDNAFNYWMRWNVLTGDTPSNASGTPEDTWEQLSTDNDWRVTGSVTQGNFAEGTFEIEIAASDGGSVIDSSVCDWYIESEDP